MSKTTTIIRDYTKKCGCNKCNTSARITEYACGCVKVVIYNDAKRCDECTNFSAMRYTAPGCR